MPERRTSSLQVNMDFSSRRVRLTPRPLAGRGPTTQVACSDESTCPGSASGTLVVQELAAL